MDHRRTENFFVVVSPGLESVCGREMEALQLVPTRIEYGGIHFAGRLVELYRANLWLRTASRILVRFAEFQSRDFPALFKHAVRLPWGRFLRQDAKVNFRVTCRSSRLMHTGRVAETLDDAVNRALGRTTNPTSKIEQLVLVRIVDDLMTISIDSSGDLLHRRGYRQSKTAAPLRETLAAGVLMLAGWQGHEPLYDPMCGSGTFLIEGALLASQLAPGLHRQFAFMNWPGWRPRLWQQLCSTAGEMSTSPVCSLAGSDRDKAAIGAARENLARLRLTGRVKLAWTDLAKLPEQAGSGLVICNPPYGLRLDTNRDLVNVSQQMGVHLRRVFRGWRCALIAPDKKLMEATGLPLQQVAILDNGGIPVGLFVSDRLRE